MIYKISFLWLEFLIILDILRAPIELTDLFEPTNIRWIRFESNSLYIVSDVRRIILELFVEYSSNIRLLICDFSIIVYILSPANYSDFLVIFFWSYLDIRGSYIRNLDLTDFNPMQLIL